MHPGIIFAIAAALASGFWTIFHQEASDKINYLFGAIIISAAAFFAGAILLLPKIKSTVLVSNPKGIIFAVLAGLCALGIDYFTLKSYGSGLAVSITGPIFVGGSVATVAIIGFFLGESFTLVKVLGLLLIIIGSGILAAFQ